MRPRWDHLRITWSSHLTILCLNPTTQYDTMYYVYSCVYHVINYMTELYIGIVFDKIYMHRNVQWNLSVMQNLFWQVPCVKVYVNKDSLRRCWIRDISLYILYSETLLMWLSKGPTRCDHWVVRLRQPYIPDQLQFSLMFNYFNINSVIKFV